MTKYKHILVTKKEIKKAINIKGIIGNLLTNLAFNILSINKLTTIYNHAYNEDVDIFIDEIFKYNNNKINTSELDLSIIPQTGPVIFLCNHPLGGWDGLAIIKTLLKIRPDTKFLVNFILSRVEPLKPYLLNVNPFETQKGIYSNITGIKEMYKHIEDGKSLFIFAAGEVSTIQKKSKTIEDKDWQKNIIKFAKNSKAPVISCFISGKNSKFFHFLGKIHPMLRTFRLPKELIRKKNTEIAIRFSGAMTIKEINKIDKIDTLANILKAKSYCLENEKSSNNIINENNNYQKIIDKTSNELIKIEIEKIKDSDLLFKTENYLCFFSRKDNIPNVFTEISRLREITFREIGEGTGKSQDFDEFDSYYHHLFLWDEKDEEIVGAYRIGLGKEILNTKLIQGFYLNSLFKFDNKPEILFTAAMEMGRSFIVQKSQRKTLPLFLLWKGIYYVISKYPEYKYLIGPASISNSYSLNSKILMVEYLKRYHSLPELSNFIEPRIPFKYTLNKNHEILLNFCGSELKNIDKLIKDTDAFHIGFPILIKKYISIGGKVLNFNIDPDFNYTIDGLVVLDINAISQDILNSYNR